MRFGHSRRVAGAMLAFSLVAGLAGIQARAPSALGATYPGSTHSWYVTDPTNSTWAYNQGCSLGTALANGGKPQQAWVILDFFTQVLASSGTWGVEYDNHVFHSNTTVQAFVVQYAHGFWLCTGADTSAHLYLGLGTRNIWWGTTPSFATRGKAWASLVASANSALGSYAAQVTVEGAIDAELGWASPSYTLAWASSFSSNSTYFYADYGDAAGCPPFGACNGGYTQASLYTLAWGNSAALPFPEIYHRANSQEWASEALYGYNHAGLMYMTGSFTEYGAVGCTNPDTCSVESPAYAFRDFAADLGANSHTAGAVPAYASDIDWQ